MRASSWWRRPSAGTALLLAVWLNLGVGQNQPSAQPGGDKLKLRLAGYPRKHNEGRVEVFYKGQWGTICDDDFTLANAHVLCRQLGFVSATGWTHSAKYGKGTGQIWLDNVQCSGSEKGVEFCESRGWGNSDCTHDEDAGVVCKDERLPGFVDSNVIEPDQVESLNHFQEVRLRPVADGAPKRMPVTEGVVEVKFKDGWARVCGLGWGPKNARVVCGMMGFPSERKARNLHRLKGGAKTGEGRVEVLRNNQWGTVCDDRWNLQAANVVCRELGFGSAKEALTGARLGQGIGPIHMSEVQCTGWEKSLWNCHFKNITLGDCKHSEDASVRCNVPYMAYEQTMRLTGGRSPTEGRVEVAAKTGNGTWVWGLVCGEGWGTREATVVCRQLGLGYAKSGLQETWYWETNNVTDMVLSGVKCTGNEMSLSHCRHHAVVNCQKAGSRFAAGVICSDTASDLVLNAPLVEQTVYIEDRPLHMLYCAAEENCLSKTAAKANWPYGHRRLLRFSSEIHNIGRADFRPKAGRHSWVWHECHRHYHSMDIFTHYDLLSVNGTKVADGHKASFCLEDTECQEGISKRYECANFGEQGITVACWDLYRHDIDCQWIDITDVKPGNYILQVIINPNYEVAESDFTNNAMKCNCKYDGHRIWLHKCHLGDAFSEEAEKRFEQYPGQLNNRIS
uniref:Lysyl oxidase homolog n=1 Tax=Scleropages formosus TaxID=113540 RepID=A0A8C9TKA5_SCLFO